MPAWTKVEADLAAVLVADLRGRGWSVYQEVEVGGGVADVVAVQGRAIWIVEAKLNLGLTVLGQAKRWIGDANLISVAVLPGRYSTGRSYALDSARAFGIGVLEVHGGDHDWEPNTTREKVRPAFARRCSTRVRARLLEQQQTYAAAGNADGKRFTPFKATCELIREELEYRGPMPVSQLVRRLGGRHHYASEASAKGSIRKWAESGKIEGVELVIPERGAAIIRIKP